MTCSARNGFRSGVCGLACGVAGLVGSVAFGGVYTWTGAAGGNWGDVNRWVGGVVPPTNGTADIHLTPDASANFTSTYDASWSSNGTINSLTFDGPGAKMITLSRGTGVTTLNIGAGGITNNSTGTQKFSCTITAIASQDWNMAAGGMYSYGASLTLNSPPGVVINKTGVNGLTISGGSSSGFQGSFRLDNGGITLEGNTQFSRLGTNAMAIGNINSTSLTFNNWASGVCSTPLVFDNLVAPTGFKLGSGSSNISADSGGIVTLTGGLFGYLAGASSTLNSSEITGGGLRVEVLEFLDRRFQLVLQGGGTLSSGGNAANGKVGVAIAGGALVLDHDSALGVSNSTAVGVGNWGNGAIGTLSSLLATTGHNVAAPIRLFDSRATSNNRYLGALGEVGIREASTGVVEFSGNIYLEATNVTTRLPSLLLTAPAGSTARFSGSIQDASTNTYYCPIVIHGGRRDLPAGTVEFTGSNTYRGTTAVRSGKLVLSNTNALGPGAVWLGDAVPTVPAVRAMYSISYVSNSNLGLFTVDGVALNDGDRVLLSTVIGDSSKYNGIWVAHATWWTRPADFDADTDLAPGLQVTVTEGLTNAGKRFSLPYFSDGGINFTLGVSGLYFHEDAVNPEVALLVNGPFTVTNAITVTSNNSTNRSSLGSTGAVAAVFSGPIALSRDVTLTASTNGSAEFRGDLAGAFGVTKIGEGLVRLTGNKSYTGVTTVTGGLFAANGTLATSGLALGSNATLQVEISGASAGQYDRTLLATGSVALGNAALKVKLTGGYVPRPSMTFTVLQVTASATISGAFASGGSVRSDDGSALFSITYAGNRVVLTSPGMGTALFLR